ncbi:MAG: hypothetical protein ABII71_01565 [Candidatus Micrarchaeota archaeon]
MRIKVCPKCQKPVEASDYRTSLLVLWGGMDPRFRCRKCGFMGPVIELTDEAEKQPGD